MGCERCSSLNIILCRVPPFTSMLDKVCSFESTQYRRLLVMSAQRETESSSFCLLNRSQKPLPVSVVHTEGDTIWPHNVIGHQGEAIHSIQPTLLYFGLFAPVCPVHEAKEDNQQLKTRKQWLWSDKISNPTCNASLLIDGVDHYGSRLLQVFCDQCLSSAAICCCHRDGLQSAVSPVEVAMDPIYCDALWGLNSVVNHCSVVWGVASHVYGGAARSETLCFSDNLVLSKFSRHLI